MRVIIRNADYPEGLVFFSDTSDITLDITDEDNIDRVEVAEEPKFEIPTVPMFEGIEITPGIDPNKLPKHYSEVTVQNLSTGAIIAFNVLEVVHHNDKGYFILTLVDVNETLTLSYDEYAIIDLVNPDTKERVDVKPEPIQIVTKNYRFTFRGIHRPDMEKPNWHYYESHSGFIQHFRKEAMEAVITGGTDVTVRGI